MFGKLFSILFLITQISFAGALDEYKKGNTSNLKKLIIEDIKKTPSDRLEGLLKLSEEYCILKNQSVECLNEIYSSIKNKVFSQLWSKRISFRKIVFKRFLENKKTYSFWLVEGKKYLKNEPPYIESEAYFLITVSLLLKSKDMNDANIIYALYESSRHVFQGIEHQYAKKFLILYPKDSRAPQLLEEYKIWAKEQYQESGHDTELSQEDLDFITKTEAKIKK